MSDHLTLGLAEALDVAVARAEAAEAALRDLREHVTLVASSLEDVPVRFCRLNAETLRLALKKSADVRVCLDLREGDE